MSDLRDIDQKLALLAHDLRTPLSAMRLTADLIGIGTLSDDQRDYLRVLVSSIDSLSVMTTELVNAASKASHEAAATRVEVLRILKDQTDLFRVSAEQKGLELAVDLDPACVGWSVDRSGNLTRAVAALLHNAIKYTESGRIVLRASPCVSGSNVSHTLLQISVEDSGPGLEAGEAERLFRPFVRGSAGQDDTPGTGLGLWGASELLKELGGELQVFPGKERGSRFVITLPARRDLEIDEDPMDEDFQPERPAPEGPLDARILVVDDNSTNRRLLLALLESFGAECVDVASGAEAREALSRERFDLILLDLNMPGMSGQECARAWVAEFGDSLAPIIAVTAAVETNDLASLRADGIRQLVSKPISPASFYRVLADALSGANDLVV
ncbi:ATP-binding response regulator [Roseibium sediminis]|uniref:ATP-binding response regulator n=1 Tax=Roseibium sediminis TaxID=1775174 RepID=UPI00123D6C57|nr:ATP-binding protein [Roseibium sediminis]